MTKTVTILSKIYIPTLELEDFIIEFAKNNKLETDYSTYISNKIDLTIEKGNNISTLGINFGINVDYFVEKKGIYIESYSFCLLISFYSEDKLLIPFLKALVQKYPDILVYNDELIDFNKETYMIYNKQDIEETKDDDYWSLLGKESKNIQLP